MVSGEHSLLGLVRWLEIDFPGCGLFGVLHVERLSLHTQRGLVLAALLGLGDIGQHLFGQLGRLRFLVAAEIPDTDGDGTDEDGCIAKQANPFLSPGILAGGIMRFNAAVQAISLSQVLLA